jgi:Cu/Ag efflux pump CusA
VVGVRAGKPVFMRDVATVRDGPMPPARYVWHGVAGKDGAAPAEYPAVTVAITKKPGENAIDVANAVMKRVDTLRNTVIPGDVQVAESRNYGASANDKAQKLITKLLFATASVVALVFVALGRREAAIVGSAVILTLTVTLFASWAWGFTLNRVSLFALIFSIGILVDDAIVVVENIHRHLADADHSRRCRRGRRPDHPGHAHRHCRPAADGLRVRADGPVHEPDPDQCQHGHAAVAGDRLCRHTLARAFVDETLCSRPRRRCRRFLPRTRSRGPSRPVGPDRPRL